MPVVWLAAYSWLGDQYHAIEQNNRRYCIPKATKLSAYNVNYLTWILLYLFIPALVLLALNIALIVKLQKMKQMFNGAIPGRPHSDLESSKQIPPSQFSVSMSVTSDDGMPSVQINETDKSAEDCGEEEELSDDEDNSSTDPKAFSAK